MEPLTPTLKLYKGKIIKLYQYISLEGCITEVSAISGVNVEEVECRLGYNYGRLRQGFFIAHLTRLPSCDEFEPGGYTNQVVSKNNPLKYNAENIDINYIKNEIIQDMVKVGCRNLIKIIPISQGIDYPPGLGIRQWVLTSELPMYVSDFIEGYQRVLILDRNL